MEFSIQNLHLRSTSMSNTRGSLILVHTAKVDEYFTIRDPTPEESENCAKECEEWCKVFPVFFPNRNITRKMIEYSLVLPRFIREKKGLMNKILRLEQAGEKLHQEYNTIENSYKCIYNRGTRFWLMIENYENKLYATR